MSSSDSSRVQSTAKSALGYGSVLAMVLSWSANHSVGWALLHGVFGWLYVIYYLLTHEDWTWF